jgi:hypothetical protein
MTLPDMKLPGRANQTWHHNGLDSPGDCLNRQHFDNYAIPISYVYNSRGFRDLEWPISNHELQQAIWCVGDSFTVGIGQPIEHIWPTVLSKRTQQRTINVSMDGASNEWILRRCMSIAKYIMPKTMIVMWSYLHRREHPDTSMTDEERRLHDGKTTVEEDLALFANAVSLIQEVPCRVVQFVIPGCAPSNDNLPINIMSKHWDCIRGDGWPIQAPRSVTDLHQLPKWIRHELIQKYQCYDEWLHILANPCVDENHNQFISICQRHDVVMVERLDLARDGHHFDIKTSEWVVDRILQRL